MRIGSLLAIVFLAAPSVAQSPRRVGVVNPPGTTARAGPSDRFPDTGIVAAGTRVVVVKEEGDFLAVVPPQGQRSWVPELVVVDPDARPGQPGARHPNGGRWDAVVAPDGPVDIPVFVGDADRPKPLDVQRLNVPMGTILTIIGPAVEHKHARWYPVEPPPGDLRYLPKAAVVLTAAPAPTFSVSAPENSGQPLATSLPPRAAIASSSSAAPGRVVSSGALTTDPLWAEAEAAVRAGDYRLAEKLYLQLAAQMNNAKRRDDADTCFARLHQVRTLATGSATPASAGAWHGPGTLQVTTIPIDGRETYAVRDDYGKTLCYVVADAGVDLERFKGYRVELYGRGESRPGLNGVSLVIASRIQQARR